jgi:hypothetical protein
MYKELGILKVKKEDSNEEENHPATLSGLKVFDSAGMTTPRKN